MRAAFVRGLLQLAERDPRVWLLTGDLGFSVLEPFAQRFPERFVNVGVAEQNMIGVAAGLAHSGKVPFVYSIANFPTLRCYEQIRNDVCYHELGVRVVSVGAGVSYGTAGYTHHGVEDLAVMRALPNMTVVSPGDPLEAELLTLALGQHQGPAYLRLGKGGEKAVHASPPAELELGKAVTVRAGRDLTLIATGARLHAAVQAAEQLEQNDRLSVRVLSLHTIKPLDEAAVRAAATETRLVVTLEEHSVVGGLGSAVASVLAGMPAHAPLMMQALPDAPCTVVGSQAYLLASLGDWIEPVRRAAQQLLRRDEEESGHFLTAPSPRAYNSI